MLFQNPRIYLRGARGDLRMELWRRFCQNSRENLAPPCARNAVWPGLVWVSSFDQIDRKLETTARRAEKQIHRRRRFTILCPLGTQNPQCRPVSPNRKRSFSILGSSIFDLPSAVLRPPKAGLRKTAEGRSKSWGFDLNPKTKYPSSNLNF